MSAVTVKNDLVNVAKKFGDVDTVVSEAVRRYAIEQCIERVENARARIREFEKRYGAPYPAFAKRVQTDTPFLRRIELKNPVWEEDAMEWKYRLEETAEWTETLASILKQ
jgi:hypothetical protein